MALRIVFADPKADPEYRRAMTAVLNGIARASSLATRETARRIRLRGQGDIARAGQFGARWQEGLFVDPSPSSGFFINNEITIGHDQIGARNFEFGGTVVGRPLLWIPLSFADPTAKAKGYPGGLFRVNRAGGRPLLLSIVDKQPKFVGVASVTIRQKWHLRDIAGDAMANDFPTLYGQYLSV